jgi:hypothetical protein
MFLPDPDFFPSWIRMPDPWVKKAPDVDNKNREKRIYSGGLYFQSVLRTRIRDPVPF